MNSKNTVLTLSTEAVAFPRASANSLRDRYVSSLRGLIVRGHLELHLPDGSRHLLGADPDPSATLTVRRWRAFLRLLTGGELGFAEAYVDGDWETPDLGAVLRLATANEPTLSGTLRGKKIARWLGLLRHRRNANSRRGSRRNISAHYDLGNAFYAQWLDPSMFYSSALFDRQGMTLQQAQQAKVAEILSLADIRPAQRVLEIGCGWGAFAEAALDGVDCTVTGITLSTEQLDHCRSRLAGRPARFELTDYRDSVGTFDRIVSIEMLEAVGEENWPTYFRVLRDRLKPGGNAVIQVITISDGRFDEYRRRADFIQKHIFPGGMLPSPSVVRSEAERAGLRVDAERFFGASYAETLRRWHRAFTRAWPTIAPLGFDARFRRLWDYYLLSCATGFDAGIVDVGLFRLRRDA